MGPIGLFLLHPEHPSQVLTVGVPCAVQRRQLVFLLIEETQLQLPLPLLL